MGKISILTPEQAVFFDQVTKNEYIRSRFYFTGGTALSEFYLQHRFSEDLDFFTEKPYEPMVIDNFVIALSKKLHFKFKSECIEDFLYRLQIYFPNNQPLKVDFSHYLGKRIEKGKIYNKFAIDSLLDIAINKIHTIQQRESIKDFVDLYYLLQEFSIWDLVHGMEVKFNTEADPWTLGADLLNFEKYPTLPKMIKPLTFTQLKKFFINESKKLGRRAVE